MSSKPIPLVLDLDGTLIHTDTFHEMMVYLLIHTPFLLLRLPYWLLKGRVYAKEKLVAHTDINLSTLPYNQQLLSFAQQEGQPLILATGTHQKLAQKISDHLGIFQDVIGSYEAINMTGPQKGKALCERFGAQCFDYAGDSLIDMSVWQVSRKALVVCPKRGVLKKAHAMKALEHIHYFPSEHKRSLAELLALRPLFWGCNLAAFSLRLGLGLSLLSSGLLILNDLLLIEQERRGPPKKQSMFAQGKLHLITAFMLVPLLLLGSFVLIMPLPGNFLYLGGYVPLFLILDRLTRGLSTPARWSLLGLFQVLAASLMGFKGLILLP